MPPQSDLFFRDVLTIQHPQTETLFSVMKRMELLSEAFARHRRHYSFLPFLKTYYYVTAAVADKRLHDPHYYHNTAAIERLDVHFASLYFQPMLQYVTTGDMQTPWNTYLNYCQRRVGISFVQMLLGINAHINADLVVSLINTSYTEKEDFFVVDTILEEVIPEVMTFLAVKHRDMIGLSGLVFSRFIRNAFRQVITQWRAQAWKHAQQLGGQQPDQYVPILHAQTEQIGEQIIDLFHRLEFKTPGQMLERLSELRVRLD